MVERYMEIGSKRERERERVRERKWYRGGELENE